MTTILKYRKSIICGTIDDAIIWCNSTDSSAIGFATFVWIAILFCFILTVVIVFKGEMLIANAIIICFFVTMALWCHAKTMLSDPGAVPNNAMPLLRDHSSELGQILCGRCECYKPPFSHHDRVSRRCISRMDHFCPWMNNAIGAKNQKNFLLFLIYTDLASTYMYIIVVLHMIHCNDDCSKYTGFELNTLRFLIFLLLFGMLFTTSMLINQIYGLVLGLGTIDRMKLKDGDVIDGYSVPFTHVFGVYWLSYFLPLDAVFDDDDVVLHYRLGLHPYYQRQ